MAKLALSEIKAKVWGWLDRNKTMGKYHPEFANIENDEVVKEEVVNIITECLDQKWQCGNTYGNDLVSAFLDGNLDSVCNYIESRHSQYIWLISCAIYNIGMH